MAPAHYWRRQFHFEWVPLCVTPMIMMMKVKLLKYAEVAKVPFPPLSARILTELRCGRKRFTFPVLLYDSNQCGSAPVIDFDPEFVPCDVFLHTLEGKRRRDGDWKW